MKRRTLLTAGLAASSATVLGACSVEVVKQEDLPAAMKEGGPFVQMKKYQWKMVTTYPKNFPGLGTVAEQLANDINALSDGQLTVKVYGAGELVPAMEALDAVSAGTAEMGFGASYYWAGKSPAMTFFTTIPFGLTAQEMNGWIYHGGGQQLWDNLYAGFGLKPFLAGNTGVQMAGWFNREINSVDDLKGLKMRIPGLGGTVMGELGVVPKLLPGGEIFTSLQSGAIDATEWAGPYADIAAGFYKLTKLYYYPGWQEPGAAIVAFVNKSLFETLPAHLQAIVEMCCQKANSNMLAEFTANDGRALDTLINQHGVQLKKLPDAVLKQLHALSKEVVSEAVGSDADSRKVYDSFIRFNKQVTKWTDISETSYALARRL